MSCRLTELLRRRELLRMLIQRNLKIRYKNSMLGACWSMLGPLFLIGIYSIFLGLIRVPVHLPTLVSGIIVWQFISVCANDSLHSILGNANLVTKASFPRAILPLSMVGANTVNFLLSFVVLLGYLLVAGTTFGPLWQLPFILLTQMALCLGLALLVGSSNVFFRDTEHVLSMVMLAWFFMSPVIYEPSMVTEGYPEWVQWAFFANPMSGVLAGYRRALLDQPSPGTAFLALSAAVSWLMLGLGWWVFHRVEPRFGDEL
jgi:ABC-type polysaccharide/polyol phosphate export permease